MIALNPAESARRAVPVQSSRPATGMLLDTDDARVVVFNLAPKQIVPPHRSDSTVLISVIRGTGLITGGTEERTCAPGDLLAFEPSELHGMTALDEPFHLVAVITPRPGVRAAALSIAAQSTEDAA
jgi:quercetin dioxygenase-like cupin family protein